MQINGQSYRPVWVDDAKPDQVQIIDQRFLPHTFVIESLTTYEEAARAIREMHVRGAPLIGATAAYGLFLAAQQAPGGSTGRAFLEKAAEELAATRPTAVDLFHAIERMLPAILTEEHATGRIARALSMARAWADESAEQCRQIGLHGLELIQAIARKKPGKTINVLTHCNAGWLACVDYGTATAPIYLAHDKGLDIHVWVDETRPRNQGARITAFELGQHGVPHTVIPDNTGGHLMQHGKVDLVIVGTDRTTRQGDVANKIGTYLKALAAYDNQVPFYVALPGSTIDWHLRDGLKEIPIEQRDQTEVTHIQGWHEGSIKQVRLTPAASEAVNYGFDVTPARLVTGLITERGVCPASETGLLGLYPEREGV
jgi:methylthioribose-1-phosphate isomerase